MALRLAGLRLYPGILSIKIHATFATYEALKSGSSLNALVMVLRAAFMVMAIEFPSIFINKSNSAPLYALKKCPGVCLYLFF